MHGHEINGVALDGNGAADPEDADDVEAYETGFGRPAAGEDGGKVAAVVVETDDDEDCFCAVEQSAACRICLVWGED